MKTRKRNIFFADLETATIETAYFKKYNDTCVNVGYIENWNEEEGEFFLNIKELIHILWKRSKSCYVYFHNLSFDGDFILKFLASNGYKCVNYENVKGKREFGFLRQLNKIYAIELCLLGKKKNLIKIGFRCSLNILSSSVEELGKSVGISKYAEISNINTFYDVEPQQDISKYSTEYLDYLKRDVKIVKKAMFLFDNELSNFLKEKHIFLKWYTKLTIGAIAYELQKRYVAKYAKVKKGFKCSLETYDLASKYYFGGFCEFNPNIQNEVVECKNGIGLDINSAHPNSMTKLLPYGELHNFKDKKPKGNHLVYLELHIDLAVSKNDNVPCLINWNRINGITKDKYRYVTQLSDFKCFYLEQEFQVLKEFYHFENVKIINKYWSSCGAFLKTYTTDLYKYKQEHSKKGQKALANTYKILLNSSYGKHATRKIYSDYYICENKKEYDSLLELETFIHKDKEWLIQDASDLVKLPNTYILKITPKGEDKIIFYHKLIASTITAYTRIKILKTILLMNPNNFLYTDTDSIYLRDYDKDKVEPLIDDYKLGYWKIEKTFDKFIVAGAKCYVYFNKNEKQPEIVGMTYSGINKRWLKDNWDLGLWKYQDRVLYKANLKRFSCKSGLVIVPIDYEPKKRLY